MAESKNRRFSRFAAQQVNEDLTIKAAALDPAGVLDSAETASIIANTSKYVQLNQSGTLEVTTGEVRWVAPNDINIKAISATVGTAPVGSSLVSTVNKNGTTIDTQTIADGADSDTNSGLSLSVLNNDYLTVDITQIGSTTAGSDLNVIIEYIDG
jgi:hypothetical protein